MARRLAVGLCARWDVRVITECANVPPAKSRIWLGVMRWAYLRDRGRFFVNHVGTRLKPTIKRSSRHHRNHAKQKRIVVFMSDALSRLTRSRPNYSAIKGGYIRCIKVAFPGSGRKMSNISISVIEPAPRPQSQIVDQVRDRGEVWRS